MTSDETHQGRKLSKSPVKNNVLSFPQEKARDLHSLGTVPLQTWRRSGETHRSSQKHECLFTPWRSSHWSPFVKRFVYKNLKPNLRPAVTTQNATENKHLILHALNAIALQAHLQGVPRVRSLLREGVPYVKIYRYNPKHLCPKLNGYGDNGQRSLKLWQLLHTYWLPNT